LKKEIKKKGKTYIETNEVNEFVIENGLPVLLTPMGIYYNYRDAMDMLK